MGKFKEGSSSSETVMHLGSDSETAVQVGNIYEKVTKVTYSGIIFDKPSPYTKTTTVKCYYKITADGTYKQLESRLSSAGLLGELPYDIGSIIDMD